MDHSRNCCFNKIDYSNLITCHFMEKKDHLRYHDIKENLKGPLNEIMLEYEYAKNIPSDIYEHIPTLYKYSCKCSVIVECGVRACVSTWAFLWGLCNSQVKDSTLKLIGVDLDEYPKVDKVRKLCRTGKVQYEFIKGNDIEVELPDMDLLFIDTWHVYGHMKRELEKYHSKVKKYIIMHDTTVDEFIGESVRCKFNFEVQMKESGYTYDEIYRGIWPAIEEFLASHEEWKLLKRYTNCNGLTILHRIK